MVLDGELHYVQGRVEYAFLTQIYPLLSQRFAYEGTLIDTPTGPQPIETLE